MARVINYGVALICLCLLGYQSLRAANTSNTEQIKWGTESILYEGNGLLGTFGGVLDGQIVLTGGTSADFSQWGRNAICLSGNAGFDLYEDILFRPLAYGTSIVLPDGILCIGGRDSHKCYREVFLITKQQGKLKISEDWPLLPIPLSNAAGVLLDNKVYIIGGRETIKPSKLSESFFVLDL